MQFHSPEFLFFLILSVTIFYLLPHRWRWLWLGISGALFYLSFIPAFLAVLLALVVLNYAFGRWIDGADASAKKGWLLAGIIVNLAALVFFKYGVISDRLVSAVAEFLDLRYPMSSLRILLPLGFSFFIFSAISYLIEIKRGRIQAERHLGYLSAFFLFFPKIAQGPIERPGSLLAQFRSERAFDPDDISAGLKRMIWGFFKKLVIADRLALYVNAVFANVPQHNGTSLAVAIIFFAFQIYADFSGYTDIALGTARLFGFKLTENFRQPYLASSIKDFWDRWHISLSTWLRDYLFLPLAFWMSRHLKRARYLGVRSDEWIYVVSILITFVICGVWHGEGLNFLLWGGLFGIFLSISRLTARVRKKARNSVPGRKIRRSRGFLSRALIFVLVTFAWVFFRGGGLDQVRTIFSKLLFQHGAPFIDSRAFMVYSFFGILCLIAIDLNQEFGRGRVLFDGIRNTYLRMASYAALLITILMIGVLDGGQFIYFQF